LDGSLGLLLHDDRASRHLPGLADILHTQRDEITGAYPPVSSLASDAARKTRPTLGLNS
jgi:hypothetical protein